ncbi:hypothetical protein [Phocaeicola sp.]
MKTLFSFLIITLSLYSCKKNDKLEYALTFAGSNRIELEKVLEHYKDSGLKYKAALFLIENMPHCYSITGNQLDTLKSVLANADSRGVLTNDMRKKWQGIAPLENKVYDAHIITSDYLIDNIERAFRVRDLRPWNKYLEFDDFCEFILPYRISNEPLEQWWNLYEKEYSFLLDSIYTGSDVVEAANIINSFLKKEGFRFSQELNISHLGASFLFQNRIGKCSDICEFYVYVARALGIPVSIDRYVYSSETRTGHTWNVIKDTTGNNISFLFTDCDAQRGKKYSDWRKIGKVLRECYGFQKKVTLESLLDENIPPFFKNPFWKDVSKDYFESSLSLKLKNVPDGWGYLGVFGRNGWHGIDCAQIIDGSINFQNIEANVIYILLSYDGYKYKELSFPFYFDGIKTQFYIPDSSICDSIKILRKNPFYYWQKEFYNKVVKGRFETSSSPYFNKPKTLYEVCDTPSIDYNYIQLEKPVKARYASYVSSTDKDAVLAELYFTNNKLPIPPVQIYGNPGIDDSVSPQMANDGDPLTCFMSNSDGARIIYDFGNEKLIDGIVFMPRNGDNCIRIDDTYELFYHNGTQSWVSLGQKTANEPYLIYNNIPHGALLYLRNLTRGVEEQPFYIKNDEQCFVTDLENKDKGFYK